MIAWMVYFFFGFMGGTMPGMSLAERVEAADTIVLARVISVQTTEHPQVFQAQLEPLAWFKGEHPKHLNAKVYAAKAGEVSLWLLQKDKNSILEETYPVLRVSPELWLYLPEPLRAKLFQAVDHAASNSINGLRLHLMRIPSKRRQPLQIWLVIENQGKTEQSINLIPERIGLSITSPTNQTRRLTFNQAIQSLKITPDSASIIGQFNLAAKAVKGTYKMQIGVKAVPNKSLSLQHIFSVQ